MNAGRLVDWGAPKGMLVQRSCASRFVRRLFFISSMSSFYTSSRRGHLIVLGVGVVAVLLFAVVALGISGEILRRAILLAVVAVVALDGERRPAKRPLSDVFRILAEHRVVTSGPSRRALRFGGERRGSFVNLSEGVPSLLSHWAALTKARRRLSLSRRDVSASAVQAAVSPTGTTIGSVPGKYIGVKVRFMRVLVVCVGGCMSSGKAERLVDPSEIATGHATSTSLF